MSTHIPRYFVSLSVVDICKNPTVQIICSALTHSVLLYKLDPSAAPPPLFWLVWTKPADMLSHRPEFGWQRQNILNYFFGGGGDGGIWRQLLTTEMLSYRSTESGNSRCCAFSFGALCRHIHHADTVLGLLLQKFARVGYYCIKDSIKPYQHKFNTLICGPNTASTSNVERSQFWDCIRNRQLFFATAGFFSFRSVLRLGLVVAHCSRSTMLLYAGPG